MPFAQNLNYATEYQRALEQAFPYSLYFGKLYSTPNNGRYRWVNSKTIEIPSISTSGRTNASRDSIGTAARNYNNSWETKTLVNERKWSTLIHPRDIDETNQVAAIANITKVFNEEHKFPEMDAYTISKIYHDYTSSIAPSTGHAGYVGRQPIKTAVTASNILDLFDQMMLNMDNARVPVTGRLLYVTNEVQSLLKNADGITRNFDVQGGGDGIKRAIHSLDEVEIIPVPAQLMKTVYDFSDENGWAVDITAGSVLMMLISPQAVITPVSYAFSNLQAPTALTEGKYYYYEESFEDVFILNNKADAIQFVVDLSPAALEATVAAGSASGKTAVTITGAKVVSTDTYAYKLVNELPDVGTVVTGYTAYTSGADITATAGDKIAVVELDADGAVVAGKLCTAV